MSSSNPLRRTRAWLAGATLALLTLGATGAWAQEDPPGRVGRLADVQGKVSWFDHEEGAWSEAERNRPLTSGDRLSTGPQARAEVRVGSTVLRLAGATELEVLRLDDQRMSFQLHAGSLALRVRSRAAAAEIDLVTAEVRLRPDRAGHYRVDRVDDTTQAGVLRGTLRIDDPEGFIIETGQRAELWREGRERRALRFAWSSLPADAFAEWVARDDQRDERSASARYVSPEMTGVEDLDRNGRWDRHPEYGVIWFPLEVQAGWAPYRYGRWAWVRPWGWTWVDEAPWGFAPFHYGRWVSWGGRWGWCPGDYVARPVYAPALVAWVGGPHVGVSITIGGPTVGWVPLAPREWYTPQYQHTPVHGDRVNPRPPGYRGEWQRPPQQVPTGPVMYTNQGVPGAVTVVPRDVLVQRQPVARGALGPRDLPQSAAQQPLQVVPPPVRETRAPRENPPQRGAPAAGAWQPGPAPEREFVPRPAQRSEPAPAPAQQPQAQPGRDAAQLPSRERQQPPVAGTVTPRETEGRVRTRPVPGAANPAPAAARPAVPAPAATAAQNPAQQQSQARPPAPTPAGPPTRPQTGPAAAPAAVPAPPRAAPVPAPERAREREAERERAKEDDRKRGPDNRGPQRDRENLR